MNALFDADPDLAAGLEQSAIAAARNAAVAPLLELRPPSAVTHIPRADVRLLLLFWLFAERWGKMGPDGVRVRLPLTHQMSCT